MKGTRSGEGSASPPRRVLDEDGQSPAATLLRAARRNGPPPPAGAKDRAMAALDRAAAQAAETAQEAPPRAEAEQSTKRPPVSLGGAKVFEWIRQPRRWPRIVQGAAVAAAALVPLWIWLRRPAPHPTIPRPAAVLRPSDAEPLIIRQPTPLQSGIDPIVVVRLGCGDARRLVRPVDIVYPRDAIAAGVEAHMVVSCHVSQGGAFERCRDVQAPANAKIDAAEVLRSVGTWRVAMPISDQALPSSPCTVRIEFRLQRRP